jgi:hypothetical protein
MPEEQLAADWQTIALVAVAAITLIVAAVAFSLARRRRRMPEAPPVDLTIDVGQLPQRGPSAEGPQLECYGMPVRLAVLVLAPAGRNNRVPGDDEFLEAIDCLVPGLAAVVTAHKPIVRRWPVQLSTQGFTHSFFNNAQLPGDRGRGTPWCAIAGRFETGSQQLLAGLVCCADKPNSQSQHPVAHIGQWMDVLRVRELRAGS